MSDKVREQFKAFMAEGDRSGYTRESLAWVCWLASRAAALEEIEAALSRLHAELKATVQAERDAGRVALAKSWDDRASGVRDAIRALAGRGA